jgi:hypothetical protein
MLIGRAVLIVREHIAPLVPGAVLNGTGALLTAVAAIVFVATEFTEGAWLVVIAVPALMPLFARVQNYRRVAGVELGLGVVPGRAARGSESRDRAVR